MAVTKPLRDTRKRYYTVEEANRALPYVRAIVADVVRQNGVVEELQQRLARVGRERKKNSDDLYSEELTQFRNELEVEEERLNTFHQELKALGVELRNMEGLCDFPSLMDGREVYLCWRLGEPTVSHWHELEAGFAGRQRLSDKADGATTPSA
ncbi:DUF2203 domain-containing protein [Paludisphaera mucosa]|uniref:DUF2203 domain-containing protein n=1 Tax=Paludisphaera mucosa TaxID=3030827 RepID=A0ABT6F3Q2_9BACT|nr:DUF2203 domain-containing protein [Paludisphaera mucosa]MDG3002169.1 DUF2203 domain-containing protein [Paludisphaera mucosa]